MVLVGVTSATTEWPWCPHFCLSWCPLSPTAAQTTQLLVEPPWMPAVLWDRVTLTCQGLGTSSDTTWYKDGQHWGQEGPENFVVTENGSYTCDRPGTGLSPPVRVSDGPLVLQAPAQAMLEGDTVTLRCRCRREMSVTAVRFCHGDKKVRMSLLGTELSLSPLQLHHSGPYHCRGWMNSWLPLWAQSVPVTVTVHGEHPTATTLTHPQPLPMDSGSQIPLPSPSQSSSRTPHCLLGFLSRPPQTVHCLFLTGVPLPLADLPRVPHCPLVSPLLRASCSRRCCCHGSPQGTGGTFRCGGCGDRLFVLHQALGLGGTAEHQPPSGAATHWGGQ
uniref:Ig-like domain-containing protein n=1 Tax=Zosterops lateralis melanops TaxID=1220523 RepID=A0A8D2PT77_ZOSLA